MMAIMDEYNDIFLPVYPDDDDSINAQRINLILYELMNFKGDEKKSSNAIESNYIGAYNNEIMNMSRRVDVFECIIDTLYKYCPTTNDNTKLKLDPIFFRVIVFLPENIELINKLCEKYKTICPIYEEIQKSMDTYIKNSNQ